MIVYQENSSFQRWFLWYSTLTFCHSRNGSSSTTKQEPECTGTYFSSPYRECAIARETNSPRPLIPVLWRKLARIDLPDSQCRDPYPETPQPHPFSFHARPGQSTALVRTPASPCGCSGPGSGKSVEALILRQIHAAARQECTHRIFISDSRNQGPTMMRNCASAAARSTLLCEPVPGRSSVRQRDWPRL